MRASGEPSHAPALPSELLAILVYCKIRVLGPGEEVHW